MFLETICLKKRADDRFFKISGMSFDVDEPLYDWKASFCCYLQNTFFLKSNKFNSETFMLIKEKNPAMQRVSGYKEVSFD